MILEVNYQSKWISSVTVVTFLITLLIRVYILCYATLQHHPLTNENECLFGLAKHNRGPRSGCQVILVILISSFMDWLFIYVGNHDFNRGISHLYIAFFSLVSLQKSVKASKRSSRSASRRCCMLWCVYKTNGIWPTLPFLLETLPCLKPMFFLGP